MNNTVEAGRSLVGAPPQCSVNLGADWCDSRKREKGVGMDGHGLLGWP